MILQELLRYAENFLSHPEIESPKSEGEWFVGGILKKSRSEMVLSPDFPISEVMFGRIQNALCRRLAGEPLQYVLGKTEFYNTKLAVGPGVLIPRPETERLVDVVLNHCKGFGEILDLCTGSGAILFALGKELGKDRPMTGVDISVVALEWAKKNARVLDIPGVRFLLGDLFDPVREKQFEIITANPPYISEKEFPKLSKTIREFEPLEALIAGTDGLKVIRRIVRSAKNYLVNKGWLVCEIGETQGKRVYSMLLRHGYRNVQLFNDYCDRNRIVAGQKVD